MSDLSEALEGEVVLGIEAVIYDTHPNLVQLYLDAVAAARSWQALVEKVEAGGRIEVVVECPHGRTELCDRPICPECRGPWSHAENCPSIARGRVALIDCPGGSRVDVTEEVASD